jgi:alanine dehydrogenase
VTELLYLPRAEVAGLLPGIHEQLDLVEQTYRALAAGRVELPPKPGVHPRKDSFIHAMPAYLRDDDVVALKWVAGYPANKARGLPYISGLIVLNDPETGLPLAIMDGAEITAARTAAASGVCVRRFAPDGWRRAAILGCGEQGRFHARLLATLNPDVHIRAYDPHPERVQAMPGPVEPAAGPREALEGAEVIVTAGPIVEGPDPVITPDSLGESWLLLPIDFDFYVRPETVAAADLFLADDVAQFEYYRELGHFQSWPAPSASVGERLAEEAQVTDCYLRPTPAQVLCCNLGIGALDAAFAHAVLERARAEGVGTELPL